MTNAPHDAPSVISLVPWDEVDRQLTAPGSMFEIEDATLDGVTIRTWKYAPANLGLIFAFSQIHADKDWIVYGDERVTFSKHRGAVANLANRLLEDGVKPGDRVAIVMRNYPEWSVAFWASVLVGAIAAPLNAWWTLPELRYGLEDCQPKVAILDGERWAILKDVLPTLPGLDRTYVSRMSADLGPHAAALEDIIGAPGSLHAAERDLPSVDIAPDQPATLFYTSGTTGKPKGAIITHRNIVSITFNAAYSLARSQLRRGVLPSPPDFSTQKSFLVSVPLFHGAGAFAILVPALFRGIKLVFQHKFDADQALALIAQEQITNFGGVPTIAWQVVENPNLGKFDLTSIEGGSFGGAPSPPELVRRIRSVFPSVEIGQGWGMTETTATVISHSGTDYEDRPTSCGRPAPTGEVRIVRGDGTDADPLEVGELWYRGPSVVRGYWNNPEATAETFKDGWVKTGDLASRDADGFIYIVDRAKDMLIRGGENIYCVEVENALRTHPAINDAAVVGRPHPTLGEEPVAFVLLRPNQPCDAQTLKTWVSVQLAAFKVPVEIRFMTEALPRNASGKLIKGQLRDLLANA